MRKVMGPITLLEVLTAALATVVTVLFLKT